MADDINLRQSYTVETRPIVRLWAQDAHGRYSLTAREHKGYCTQAELQSMLAAGRTPFQRAPIVAVEYEAQP